MLKYDFTVIGGGAAGIFAALCAKENAPTSQVAVLEKSAVLLSKVRVSGGGRCNVTHACFDPTELVKNYPRGHKELLGPFHQFQPRDTIEWFKKNGVELKTEADGRMFPTTDSSSTIIDALLKKAQELEIPIALKQRIEKILKVPEGFEIAFANGERAFTKNLLLATGSSREGYAFAESLGHTIREPVPSLFTFNIPGFSLDHLSGIAVDPIEIKVLKLVQKGPLLITHFGFSGPAVLKLSAWGARELHACGYQTECVVNWLPAYSEEKLFEILKETKAHHPQKIPSTFNPFYLPKNLWRHFVAGLDNKWGTLSDKLLRTLAHTLHADPYQIEGKTTHKEEFVTCGGVNLKEIDFKTMKSKVCPGLFFAGEILDIDGVTGGFNFQNAWTTSFIAGTHAC